MIHEKELSVFQADCENTGKTKNCHISENTAKLTKLKAVYFLKL